MDRVCVRCAHLSLGTQRTLYRSAQVPGWRAFTTSVQQRADDSSKPSQSARPPVRTQSQSSPASSAAPVNKPPRGGLLIRRTSSPSPPRSNQNDGSSQGKTLTRSGPSRQTGQLLRRSGPPRQGGGSGGRPGGAADAKGGKKLRRRVTSDRVKAKEAGEERISKEALDQYVTQHIDRPPNPTVRLDYNPKPQDLSELQKDWPNTPLSSTGLSASVTQKIEWLARRLPHGYQTPEQLAEHFHKGNLTRFESEEEKQEVLKIAAELAQKRASLLSERKGSEKAAEDMSYVNFSSRDEKTLLMNQVVKGKVSDLERQRMPFLESVTRNLRNNGTYNQPGVDKFMSTVQRLMPAQSQRRAQSQAQKQN